MKSIEYLRFIIFRKKSTKDLISSKMSRTLDFNNFFSIPTRGRFQYTIGTGILIAIERYRSRSDNYNNSNVIAITRLLGSHLGTQPRVKSVQKLKQS